MTANPSIDVHVQRQFSAPAEKIFDAWLDPAAIGLWMFGPNIRDEEVKSIQIDPHVGGHFSFVVVRQGAEIDHIGEYLEIIRPNHLAFTWAVRQAETQFSSVMIRIQSNTAGCELDLVHRMHADWADYRDRVRDSWTKMLDALAKYAGSS